MRLRIPRPIIHQILIYARILHGNPLRRIDGENGPDWYQAGKWLGLHCLVFGSFCVVGIAYYGFCETERDRERERKA